VFLSVVIEKDYEKVIIVEADHSPFTEKKKKILKQIEIENDDLVDLDDLHT
jgi:hypothetical protein